MELVLGIETDIKNILVKIENHENVATKEIDKVLKSANEMIVKLKRENFGLKQKCANLEKKVVKESYRR